MRIELNVKKVRKYFFINRNKLLTLFFTRKISDILVFLMKVINFSKLNSSSLKNVQYIPSLKTYRFKYTCVSAGRISNPDPY